MTALAENAQRWVERLVIGADFGADGYTTLAQADELVGRLRLRPEERLLDLGTGCGWPGIYLVKKAGCSAVLADLPGQSLSGAAARTARERLGGRCAVVAATGDRIPFAADTFDAVVHADVLCCLTAKVATLTDCRRVLRRHGQMAFFTISVTPGRTPHDYDRAVRAGPPAVAASAPYHQLLRFAGFTRVQEVDITDAYLDTARQWLHHQQQFAADLAAGQPPGSLDDRLRQRRAAVAAIEAGLLRRSLFIAGP